ncbi:LytR/AlgR family response regulator transcription factor [Litoribacter populi]|uniref:LytR/AlgR family response regulator transcription factor n=1 Tax=Litoribacter populi TaxID=2598460 RepID=UPI0011803D8B|nr:response regulator transcription factor [Litoribacter populi]
MERILIVEDDHELATNFQDILEDLGYEVPAILADGKEILNYLHAEKIDLILLDILIHGKMEGLELAQTIKQVFPEISIVFCTGLSEKSILDRVSTIHQNGYLLKPFTKDSLKSAVYLALNGRHRTEDFKIRSCLKIRDKGHLVLVPVEEVLFLKADGMYTKIHTLSKCYTVRDILKDVVEGITDHRFQRVHKSFIINVDHVTSFNSKEIVIQDHIIPMRRGFSKVLKRLFEVY